MKKSKVHRTALRSAGAFLLRMAAGLETFGFAGRAQARMDDRTAKKLEEWLSGGGYRKNQCLEDVSDELGVSSSQLSYFCSKIIGTPFPVWRRNLRISEAKKLICDNPDTPLALVGRMVGIPDKSNFRKLFVAATGMTPSQWRDECRSLAGE